MQSDITKRPWRNAWLGAAMAIGGSMALCQCGGEIPYDVPVSYRPSASTGPMAELSRQPGAGGPVINYPGAAGSSASELPPIAPPLSAGVATSPTATPAGSSPDDLVGVATPDADGTGLPPSGAPVDEDVAEGPADAPPSGSAPTGMPTNPGAGPNGPMAPTPIANPKVPPPTAPGITSAGSPPPAGGQEPPTMDEPSAGDEPPSDSDPTESPPPKVPPPAQLGGTFDATPNQPIDRVPTGPEPRVGIDVMIPESPAPTPTIAKYGSAASRWLTLYDLTGHAMQYATGLLPGSWSLQDQTLDDGGWQFDVQYKLTSANNGGLHVHESAIRYTTAPKTLQLADNVVTWTFNGFTYQHPCFGTVRLWGAVTCEGELSYDAAKQSLKWQGIYACHTGTNGVTVKAIGGTHQLMFDVTKSIAGKQLWPFAVQFIGTINEDGIEYAVGQKVAPEVAWCAQ